jgi:hypothetical protein
MQYQLIPAQMRSQPVLSIGCFWQFAFLRSNLEDTRGAEG